MERNPMASTLAFKKCKGKIVKVAELGIVPNMPEDETEALIETLANIKVVEDGIEFKDAVKGQRWYVESLIKFSGLDPQAQFDAEYDAAIEDTASEDEMVDILAQMQS